MALVNALFETLPALARLVPHEPLGDFPTRVEPASAVLEAAGLRGELWLKRDDASSPVYGGNKLRLLELLLAQAKARGAGVVYATGAAGSNFIVATALHAPRLGLAPGAICFPQPLTAEGEKAYQIVAQRAELIDIAHWSLLPVGAERARRAAKERGQEAYVLSQVSYPADALFGYVAAGLELVLQVARKECPAPRQIVLPIGSAATSAGILAGLSIARKIGIHVEGPSIHAVRIAAWPLSRRARVQSLALRATRRLAELLGKPELELSRSELLPVTIVTDQLGPGYPFATTAGSAARILFDRAGFPILDDTYSAKAAAHALLPATLAAGPVLLWCTKSSAPLPRA